MSQFISQLWSDPVWSTIIASVILASLSYLFLWASRHFGSVWPFSQFAKLTTLWRRRTPKTLVFLSSGSTCRDPMAKAIMSKLLVGRKLKHPIIIRAAGLGPISEDEASYAARYVIKEIYGEDLLIDHKPELLTVELAKRADLILVMDKSLLLTPGKTLPKEKTFLLKEYFGLNGDLRDPWPDGKDPATLSRYRRCAEELQQVLSQNLDRLVDVLDL